MYLDLLLLKIYYLTSIYFLRGYDESRKMKSYFTVISEGFGVGVGVGVG
ncbi:MAG: hypothetical protein RL613_147, partial [Fusobacteriota bacterium]